MSHMGCLKVPYANFSRFLFYINELYVAVNFSEMHQLADYIDLLNFNNYVNFINKPANHDVKSLENFL